MDIVAKYNHAALNWDDKLHQLGYHRAYRQFLESQIETTKPVLDIGTGTGAFAYAWMQVGGSSNITLLDTSREMLAWAQHRFYAAGITTKIAHTTLEKYQPKEQFHTVLAAHVIEHCADPTAAFFKMAKCLSPDGKLILSVSKPHWCNWLIWLRYRHSWFGKDEITSMALAAGLTQIKSYDYKIGPPSRTSRGYIFVKTRKEEQC